MGQAYGLYSHIRANWWRSIFLLIGMFLLFSVVLFAMNLAFVGASYSRDLGWLIARACA